MSTYDKPRVVACAEDHPHHIGLPRGCLDDVRQALADLGVRTTVCDERHNGRPLDLSFHGELRPEQKVAADAMLAHETGVLAATTAFGKTVIAARLIAERGVSTLVLVHRRQLLDQWIERLSVFLGVPAKSIGRIGGGRRRPTGLLDVALIQSLTRQGVVDDCVGEYGQLIVDECHHLSATSFEQVARQAKARFVAGLSATVARKDGHHPILFMQCGPVRHRVNARAQAAARPFEHFVLVQPTAFLPSRSFDADKRVQFQAVYQELIDDELRTRRICDDVVECVSGGRSPLVLTERNDHLDRLEQGLAARVRHLVVLRAGMGKKQRQAVVDRLAAIPREDPRVILATGKYVGEGFDDPRLDTLFLTLPVSWRGTIAQYAGRLHRLYDGKREVRVYDYADLNVPMLARMFDRRCRGYEAIGYTVLLPASAIPGWPADVILPSDPVWKRDAMPQAARRHRRSARAFRLRAGQAESPTVLLGPGETTRGRRLAAWDRTSTQPGSAFAHFLTSDGAAGSVNSTTTCCVTTTLPYSRRREVCRFDERQIVQRGTVCDDDHCLDGAKAASLSLRTSSKERSRKTPWALRNPSISYRDSIPSSRRAWETVSFPERTPSSAMASNAARARPLASDASRRASSSGISKWTSVS